MKAPAFFRHSLGGSRCNGCAVQGRAGVKPPRVREDQPAREPPKVVAVTPASPAVATGPALKDLYEIGEIPPLGHVPKQMYAWAIRKDRHGPPDTAMQVEVLPTWELDSHDVLVLVMAAGVNYNGVWAALGKPITPLDVHKNPFHIAGSDASGIVYAVGSKVKRWKVGDEVVIHCNQDDGDDEECNGGDPMFSPSQRIWGYETPTAPSPSSAACRTAS